MCIGGFDLIEISRLAVHLPLDSAVVRAERGDSWWITPEVEFLREVEHGIRLLAWLKTEDGHKGRNFPEPIPLPGDELPTDTDIVGAGVGFDSLEEADQWRADYFARKELEKAGA